MVVLGNIDTAILLAPLSGTEYQVIISLEGKVVALDIQCGTFTFGLFSVSYIEYFYTLLSCILEKLNRSCQWSCFGFGCPFLPSFLLKFSIVFAAFYGIVGGVHESLVYIRYDSNRLI